MKTLALITPCLIAIITACSSGNHSTAVSQESESVDSIGFDIEDRTDSDTLLTADAIIYNVSGFKTIMRIDTVGENYEAHAILYVSDTDSLRYSEYRFGVVPDNKAVIYFKSLKDNKIDTIHLNKKIFLDWLAVTDTIYQEYVLSYKDDITISGIDYEDPFNYYNYNEFLKDDLLTLFICLNEPDTSNSTNFLYIKKWGEEAEIVFLENHMVWDDDYETGNDEYIEKDYNKVDIDVVNDSIENKVEFRAEEEIE